MKKSILILSLLIIISGVLFYLLHEKKNNIVLENNGQIVQDKEGCLHEDEVASYEIKKADDGTHGIVGVSILNKNKNQTRKSFQIDTLSYNHYHPIELHKCEIYVIREFGFDSKKMQPLEDFSVGLWRYSFNSIGKELVNLAGRDSSGTPVVYYSYDFRVDSNEKYVVLSRGYLGSDDYAMVIKDIETKKDIFVWPMKEIAQINPDIVGNFGMNEWTKDGKYYWGNFFDGADVLAYFRIEAGTWKKEIFPVPEGTMGGDTPNVENGFITFDDGAPWTGDSDYDEMYREQWKKEGKKVSFYLYNLFTKEKVLLGTDADPTSAIQGGWVSDREFDYTLPNGEKKVYKY